MSQLAESIQKPSRKELDVLLSTGEQVTIALLSMALIKRNIKLYHYGGQGIITDSEYTKARILDIDYKKIHSELNQNKVVIVAGFQGKDSNDNITTLGRGGSDTE